ncbi:hypothetical protein AAG570_003715 [Ranatra chinensis]|uniref:Uncharacterized protein n=1 Tax=Ranatra chinensis TaxID=642074 RepID=A0ABD0Y4I5_9HEMI
MKLWKYFVKYFPQRLVKTADLPPISNYIFCTFPHGIMCSGAFAQFAFDTSDFAKQYPGLTITCHTLNTNFYIPFSRDYEALLYQLNKPCGRAVNLVVGGSAEAMKSKPGIYRVVLKNRKGFIKLALITGTPLVPIYIFGEVDLYDQNIFPESSFVYKCQQAVRKLTGVAPCWFRGEGLFGILPKRVPVTTVIGRPIPVQKTLNPTSEEIDKLHKIFIRDLVALFDEYKYQYIANPDTSFLSVED